MACGMVSILVCILFYLFYVDNCSWEKHELCAISFSISYISKACPICFQYSATTHRNSDKVARDCWGGCPNYIVGVTWPFCHI